MNQIIEKIKKLDKTERNYLIFKLLEDDIINYEEISQIYVNYLKNERKKSNVIISGLSIPLSDYWDGIKNKKEQAIFMKCKSAWNMLKGGVYHTSRYEKILEKYIKKYKYSEDENGFHKFGNKKQ